MMLLFSPITPLEHGMRHVLDQFHSLGLPWAWAIVATTVAVRMLLVPLTVKQIHSMQNLQRFAPQMKEIQQKYKGDKQKQNEELMRFYKEHKINPAASCLPMLAQLPVFISLYLVLKHAPYQAGDDLGWLGLINLKEHATTGWGPLLIVIYVSSQLASSYFMSTTVDKNQRVLLMVLPVLFIPFIIRFPVGLVLYWVTTNLWTVGQGLVTRRLIPKTPIAQQPKRSSRTPPKEVAAPALVEGSAGDGAPKQAQRPPAPPRRVKRKKKRGGTRR